MNCILGEFFAKDNGHPHLLLDVVVPPEAESERHLNGKFAPGRLGRATD